MMMAAMKIAVLLLLAVIAVAVTAEARQLLDYFDDCYNRKQPSFSASCFLHHAVYLGMRRVWSGNIVSGQAIRVGCL